MSARTPDRRVLPPSIADERGRAVLALMTRIAGEFDWGRELAVTWADAPSAMLPYAVRSLALQEIVQPGMREEVVRRFLPEAWRLHALQGRVSGVRFGLGLLGMEVEWVQWFRAVPPGPPGTYVASIRVTEALFDRDGLEPVVTAETQRAAARMVNYMKRWSQAGSLRFALEHPAALRIGALVRSRIRIRASAEPVSRIAGAPPLFVGALARSRIRFHQVS
jgi:phage tail P2-like protein